MERNRHVNVTESFRAVIEFSLAGVKVVVLINGGAAIAILALVGHLYSVQGQGDPASFAPALLIFAFGVFLGAVGAVCAYVAQHEFTREVQLDQDVLPWGRRAQVIGIVAVSLAVFCFLVGIVQSYVAIT